MEGTSKQKRSIAVLRGILLLIGWGTLLLNHLFLMNGVHHSYTFIEASFHGLKLFTIQSNVLALLALSYSTGKHPKGEFFTRPKVRTAIGVYITVTMLTFFLVLRQDYRTTGILHGIHIITHYVIPTGYLIHWFFTVDPRGFQWRWAVHWLIYPAAYGVFSLGYGVIAADYAYPFLDITVLTPGAIIVNFFLGLSGFYLLGLSFIAIQKKRGAPD